MTVLPADDVSFEFTAPVLIIGAGACGLTAALAARDAGAEVVVLERDPLPSGSTSLSAGLVPAAGTRIQKAAGIDDSPDLLIDDLRKKTRDRLPETLARAVADGSARAVDWLAETHAIPFEVIGGFLYPGHSVLRMHGVPERTGSSLMGHLMTAAETAGIDILTDARTTALFADTDGGVRGVEIARPDGTTERIGCEALILACNGYGGNAGMVEQYMPEMTKAVFFGHAGNTGDAITWGADLGAELCDLGCYQGHGSVAHPHGILISWAVITEGGFQVNANGARFSDETHGYSEQAVEVLAQPDAVAWSVFGQRQDAAARQFQDYRDAEDAGALKTAATVEELAETTGIDADGLKATFAEVETLARSGGADAFGRVFDEGSILEPPLIAVRVTGALFHTQGGLRVGPDARVQRADGSDLPNMFAGGGAAQGLSGPEADGYLSGNGLLTAVTLGHIAGRSAARLVG